MPELVRLTNRECTALLRLAIGETLKGVATHLGISLGSAKRIARNAYQKLGVEDMDAAFKRHGFHKESRGRSCYCIAEDLSADALRGALDNVRAFKDRGWEVQRSTPRHPKVA